MMGLAGASIGILDIGKEVPSYGNVISATRMAREDRRLDGGNVVIIIAALNMYGIWYDYTFNFGIVSSINALLLANQSIVIVFFINNVMFAKDSSGLLVLTQVLA